MYKVQYVQSRIGNVSTKRLHKLLPSELTNTKTCSNGHSSTPLALHEDHKPGNTNEVLPSSQVQQHLSQAGLDGHERSGRRNISLLECWRYDVIFNNVHTYIMTSFGKIIRSIVV